MSLPKENRQCFVNIIAAICIFLFILLQYEESRFSRGPPIENYINSTFKVKNIPFSWRHFDVTIT